LTWWQGFDAVLYSVPMGEVVVALDMIANKGQMYARSR
jgi:hypothetical protein